MGRKMNIALKAILGDRVVAYHPLLAKLFGSVEAALFLSQMLYYLDKTTAPDGWAYETREKITEDTGLTRHAQDRARAILASLDVLKEERRGVPATMHYWVDVDKLEELICAHTSGKSPPSLPASDKLDCQHPTNQSVDGGQTIQRVPQTSTEEEAATNIEPAQLKWQQVRGGAINYIDGEQINALIDEFTSEWVVAAIDEANRCKTSPFVSLKFVEAILRRWKVDGFKAAFKGRGKPQERDGPATVAVTGAMLDQLFKEAQ